MSNTNLPQYSYSTSFKEEKSSFFLSYTLKKVIQNKGFLLHSGKTNSCHQYHIWGINPIAQLETNQLTDLAQKQFVQVNIIDYLKNFYNTYETFNPSIQYPFIGGWLGYIGYEFKSECESKKLFSHTSHKLWPNICLKLYKQIWIYDTKHQKQLNITQKFLLNHCSKNNKYHYYHSPKSHQTTKEFNYFSSKKSYLKGIDQIKSYIRKGDIYQANISRSVTGVTKQDLFKIVSTLFDKNPAPMQSIFFHQNNVIISTSPERLYQLKPMNNPTVDNKVEKKNCIQKPIIIRSNLFL